MLYLIVQDDFSNIKLTAKQCRRHPALIFFQPESSLGSWGKFEFSLIQVLNEVGTFCVALQVASIWIVGTVHRSLPYRRPGLHRWPK